MCNLKIYGKFAIKSSKFFDFFCDMGFFSPKKFSICQKNLGGWFRGEKLVQKWSLFLYEKTLLEIEISFNKNRRHLTYALYNTCIKSLVIFSRYLLRYVFIIFMFFVSWIFYVDRGMNGTVRVFCSSDLESTVTITTDGAFEVSGVDTVTR